VQNDKAKFKNAVRGFIGFPQKSQIFVGDFSLVHNHEGSHYKKEALLRMTIKKGAVG
jgi:hypothetical protein